MALDSVAKRLDNLEDCCCGFRVGGENPGRLTPGNNEFPDCTGRPAQGIKSNKNHQLLEPRVSFPTLVWLFRLFAFGKNQKNVVR